MSGGMQSPANPALDNVPLSDTGAGEEQVVRLEGGFDPDGTPSVRTLLTPDSDKRRKEVYADDRQPIPVVFLPGVMGSLLLSKEDSTETVWYPPNMDAVLSSLGGVLSIIRGWFRSAAGRASRYDPLGAVVDPFGPVDVGDCGLDEDEARRRGWGTVHRWSYHPTLAWLESTLNNPMKMGKPIGEWAHGDPGGENAALKAVLGTDPKDYGAFGEGQAITADSDEFKALARYRYPVYAIGYNFLQSNEKSAQEVLDGLSFKHTVTKEVTPILGIRQICRENHTDKAIIITHSMGGLVARMASAFCGGENDILGVIHGVQPATGAPLFAKRLRTGAEGFINESLLGRDDAEFVAIASNAEGPMELSPTPDYNDGAPWWIFVDKRDGREIIALPEKDAIRSLYTDAVWYGLLPDRSLLDPAGVVEKMLKRKDMSLDVFEYYSGLMQSVVERQERLVNTYHPNTFALYADGNLKPHSTAESKTPKPLEPGLPAEKLQTWGKVLWEGAFPDGTTKEDLIAAKLIEDDHNGTMIVLVRGQFVKVTVQKAAVIPQPGQRDNGIVPGDGTVPALSAAAQGRGLLPGVPGNKARGVQMVFVQGGYEHQASFNHPWSRWATLYSVARIVHSVEGLDN